MSTMTLEPCPFCGTDDHETSPWPSGDKWVCRCGNPDCAVEVTAETPEAAVAKWNRRAQPAKCQHDWAEGYGVPAYCNHCGTQRDSQPAQAVDVERQWREMLAIYVAGPMLYTDDGELSDATREPAIDFLRDSADTVARKLADRSRAISGEKAGPVDGWKLVPRNPTPAMLEASAVEWTRLCHGYAPDSGHYSFMGALWDSMLAASPAPDKEGL